MCKGAPGPNLKVLERYTFCKPITSTALLLPGVCWASAAAPVRCCSSLRTYAQSTNCGWAECNVCSKQEHTCEARDCGVLSCCWQIVTALQSELSSAYEHNITLSGCDGPLQFAVKDERHANVCARLLQQTGRLLESPLRPHPDPEFLLRRH